MTRDPLVLGKSQVWPAIAIPGAAAVVMIVVWAIFGRVVYWAVIAVAAAVILAVARRGNAVLADDVGLLIRRRGTTHRSYAWTEIERMGWRDAGLWGSTLVVHPRGGPYDVPGPNSPIDVGHVWRPRRRSQDDPLPGLRQRHTIKALQDS